ncbi:MAG: polymerase, sigma-24 subunit, subfamily [Cyanobacteria bacterium RYN_339]|nr:polymerase, sigma-24 subunit, subfamily [Cyanobacteria bacterium RYN_339]
MWGLLLAAALATPPPGWGLDGEGYEAGTLAGRGPGGGVATFLRADGDAGAGWLGQDAPAKRYAGKRLRLTAWARQTEVKQWGGLWLRVEGAGRKVLALDDMRAQALVGTGTWRQYELVLDVPPEARTIWYGGHLQGAGTLWLAGFSLGPVSRDIPLSTPRQEAP